MEIGTHVGDPRTAQLQRTWGCPTPVHNSNACPGPDCSPGTALRHSAGAAVHLLQYPAVGRCQVVTGRLVRIDTHRNRIPLLAGTAAALWAAAIALTIAIANASGPPAIDTGIADPVHAWALDNPWAVSLARMFALMGSGAVLFPITVVVVLVLLRNHRWWALWVAACGIGGLVISQVVKRTIDRQRPVWPDPFEAPDSFSFPSGHTMAGIYGWVVFGIVALYLLRGPWNRIVGVALIAFGVLMGPSRVVFGVHWPTDVLGGWLYASAWVLTVTALLLWRRYRIAPGT